ncbi:MAG: CoA transferase [Rhodobacteraceae bacterium]|jgi:benzylsuccinate CoA-transferase BbsF subunit|nr:CoA transferase [Paracoccaceae bacterium]
MRQLALAGTRVVDFSWVVAGPMTTKMLAAMGAEVIKVESTRRPEFKNRGGYFAVLNNGKRSITVNIGDQRGQVLLRRLIAMSDVVVENFSRSVLMKNGLSYEEIRKVRPDIVFCSASGVGRTGPQAEALAYGTLLQGYSGRAGLVGAINAEMEAMGIVPAWTDPVTAIWEVTAILAALRHRRRTGEGAYLDLSMLESTVAELPEALLRAQLGLPPEREDAPARVPEGIFRCRGEDSWLALSVRNDADWAALAAVIGRPGLADELPALADRRMARARIDAAVGAWARGLDAAEAERALVAAGVPAARSRSTGDILDDPHSAARGIFPEIGGVRSIALPWRDEEGWRGALSATPAIGADNDHVFRNLLGLSGEEMATLVREEVIV